MENIFTVCEVPRVKGCENDKMLKSQLDSNCLKFGGGWVSPYYRQLPGPPLLESPALSAGDGGWGGMPPILFASFGPWDVFYL